MAWLKTAKASRPEINGSMFEVQRASFNFYTGQPVVIKDVSPW